MGIASRGAATVAAVLLLGAGAGAQERPVSCVKRGETVPKGANTSDPGAPFFVDTRHLDLRTTPPTRDPRDPSYPAATDLGDGALPPADRDGNFILGPTHRAAPEIAAAAGMAHGTVRTFTMRSADSVIFRPGYVRDDAGGCENQGVNTATTAPGDPSDLQVPTSHAGSWTRQVDVYVPAGYAPGTAAPLLVFGDGSAAGFFHEKTLFAILDTMIARHELPPMVAVGIGAGGQDAQGSERGREYDAVNGAYADWVEREVIPRVEREAGVRITRDPDGRATMGFSSSAAAAFTMAWFRPELYHRVLAYSPTMVNQQWPHDPALPGGAWEYHDRWPGPARPALMAQGKTASPVSTGTGNGAPLIPNTPAKPIRFWFEAADRDLFYVIPGMPDGMHDWTLAAERTAAVLAEKNYHYQFVFSRNAKHVDDATEAQTLPEALRWVWRGYHAPTADGGGRASGMTAG